MRSAKIVAITLLFMFACSARLPAFHDTADDDAPTNLNFNVGKNGEVNLSTDVRIGNHLVKKGKYVMTHRAEGSRHTFVLALANAKKGSASPAMVEFDSRFTSGSERVTSSTFFARRQRDDSYEVINIQILGENGDHVIIRSDSPASRP